MWAGSNPDGMQPNGSAPVEPLAEPRDQVHTGLVTCMRVVGKDLPSGSPSFRPRGDPLQYLVFVEDNGTIGDPRPAVGGAHLGRLRRTRRTDRLIPPSMASGWVPGGENQPIMRA